MKKVSQSEHNKHGGKTKNQITSHLGQLDGVDLEH
jgi:hypothetical protein